jgi:hypothetical protein
MAGAALVVVPRSLDTAGVCDFLAEHGKKAFSTLDADAG